MALGTPTIVSGPQNTGDISLTGGTQLTGMTIRYFADFQKYLDPTETPFTSSLKTGAAVDAKKIEWGSSYLMPHQSHLGAAVVDTTGTSFTVATGDGPKFMPTMIIQIDTEKVRVTAVAGDVLTVQRAAAGSTAATHTNTTLIEILSPAAIENADTPLWGVAKGSLEYNYPQLMDFGIQVSNREDATPDYEFDGGSRYDAYLQKRMKEAAIFFEKTSIRGGRSSEAAMTGAGATPTTMGGLDFFTDTAYDMTATPITEYTLQTVLKDSWSRVGSENTPTRLLVGGFMRIALDSLWNANRYATVKDDVTNLTWRRVSTSFGDIEFVLSRYIPDGTAYLINTGDITVHPYKNGAWKEVKLPAAGPYIKGRFTGDYTMVFRKNAARAKIINISTTVSDYPNL